MEHAKLEATGPPVLLTVEVHKGIDGSFYARFPQLPGMYFSGRTQEEVSHIAASAMSLLAVAARMTGSTVEQLWAEKGGLVQSEIIGEEKNGQIAFSGRKAGNA
jgi:predicted RNase H-like HicB family nuclease